MKAVLVHRPGGPDALQYQDVPMPVPGETDVLIRAETFGVGQPDKLIRSGVYKWMPPLPANPGNDVAGRIEAVGSAVRDIKVGQKVLLSARDLAQRGGCYAEMVAAPADAIHLLPEQVDLEAAVCLANYQVAWALLNECGCGASAEIGARHRRGRRRRLIAGATGKACGHDRDRHRQLGGEGGLRPRHGRRRHHLLSRRRRRRARARADRRARRRSRARPCRRSGFLQPSARAGQMGNGGFLQRVRRPADAEHDGGDAQASRRLSGHPLLFVSHLRPRPRRPPRHHEAHDRPSGGGQPSSRRSSPASSCPRCAGPTSCWIRARRSARSS